MYLVNRDVRMGVLAGCFVLLFLSVFAAGSLAQAEKGPFGQWDFDEGKGDVLNDKSGNKSHGKIEGATWVKVTDGFALNFDGVDDRVVLPAEPTFYNAFGPAWTIEMWVKPGTISSGVKLLFDKPFTQHKVPYYQIRLGMQFDNGNQKNYGVQIHRPTDGAESLGAYGPAGSAVAEEWTHLVAVFDRNSISLTLYKNGEKIAEDTTPSDRTALCSNFKTGAALGCLFNTGSYRFKGAMTRLRTYNRALSQKEIKASYNESAEKFGLKQAVAKENGGKVTSSSAEAYVIPYDVDPPITVDGKLDDWNDVPNTVVLNKKEQVTYNRSKAWTGPADLSGTIRLAWRTGFYIAAEVTDDVVGQPYAGRGIYNGDHINLWVDFQPALEPDRILFGEGQYHIAISPGNFGGKVGGDKPIRPEIVVYLPEGVPAGGGEVVARRTASGYVIEAFVPFSHLRMKPPVRDQYATFEVALGDSDSAPAAQEKFMTSGTKQWHYLRSRMMPLVFGSGSGQAALPMRAIPVPGLFSIPKTDKQTVKFPVGAIDPASQQFLFFRARLDSESPAGYGGQLTIDLNGERLRGQQLSNRAMTATMEDNRELIIATSNGRITLPSAPDFTSMDKNRHGYALRGGVKSSEYEFFVGGLLKEGENTIIFKNVSGHPLHGAASVGDIELRIRPRTPGSKFRRGAPTGELPVYEPQTSFPKTYSRLTQGKGKISLAVGKDTYFLESRFSTPDGKWQTGSNKFFSHQRKVIEHDEWIEVRDTFRNLTDDNLPLMQEHDSVFKKEAAGVWLSGMKKPFKTGTYNNSENTSVFATASESGLGMIPLNDEFMVHVRQSAKDGKWVRISDDTFMLKKGGEYTAEWAIVPVRKADYFTFVNAARRMLDTNFPLKWMSAFVQLKHPVYDWPDRTLKEFVDNKSANLLIQGNQVSYDPYYREFWEKELSKTYGGKYKDIDIRCTTFLLYPPERYIIFQKRMRELYPDRSKKTAIYFHFFLDTYEPNNTRFAADRALDAKGNHITYGPIEYLREFVPTLNNDWGKENAKVIDKILDEIGADGLYIDEFSFSHSTYVYNLLDGCSADIDPVTHKLTRLKGSVALLSRDYRLHHVKRVLDRGCPFIINGQPHTRTLRKLNFQAFVETGSGPANCMRTHLYSPVILGDHLTEDTYKEIYQNMLMGLDGGCLYAYYYSGRFMQNKTLAEYMYPFTPIELHKGYVIGKERILTNRSGLFGWADDSDFKAHVYDDDSKETDGSQVKKVTRDGKTYAEVRMPEGYSAAIVRVVK